jgi:prolyl-tRNA synthetase
MFADADLIGLPKRLVVSKKTVQKNAMELKNRTSDKVQLVEPGALAKTLRD